MNLQSDVWVLKYAPKSIDELILSEENKVYFSALTDIPNNFLFLGRTGAGKTTLAKLLAKKFSPNSYIYINASDENGIDVVRNEINGFISTVSFDGTQKIVILDECDGLSQPAQQALRGIMEEYLDDVKFILTGNYKHKLIEALLSRCQSFEFSIDRKAVSRRVCYILKSEGIDYSEEKTRQGLMALIKKHYPDIRKIINELQKSCASGQFIFNEKEESAVALSVFERLKAKENVYKIREHVIVNESDFNNDYHFLMRELFEFYVLERNTSALLLIADHMYKSAFVSDQEVNFSALIFNLSNI